jgi:hypothetical protein
MVSLRRSAALAAAWVGLGLGTVGCKRSPPHAASESSPLDVTFLDGGAPFVCSAEGAPRVIAPLESPELGRVVRAGAGVVVGLTYAGASGRAASVLAVSDDAAPPIAPIALASTFDDAPAPAVAVAGERVWAAFVTHQEHDGGAPPRSARMATRVLSVARLEGARVARIAAIAKLAGEGTSVDLAPSSNGVRVVWDDDAPGSARGVIATLATDAGGADPAPAAVHISPDDVDAERPRVLSRGGSGHFVAWLAHRAESEQDAGARDKYLEQPGEKRQFGWVQVLALSGEGAVQSTPVDATSPHGHADGFDWRLRPDGETLELLVHDAGETQEGAGGRLGFVTFKGAPVRSTSVADGVGRGDAAWVPLAGGDGAAWASYVDAQDHFTLAFVDSSADATRAGQAPRVARVDLGTEPGRAYRIDEGAASGPAGQLAVRSLLTSGHHVAVARLACARP